MRVPETDDVDRARLEVALRALLDFLERCGGRLRGAPARRGERLERVHELLTRPAADDSDSSGDARH